MPRPRVHDEAVRRRLLETASAAVAEHGTAGLSLRSVAAAAGTTTAAVYALFGGRDELVQAVVDEGFGRFAAHLAAVDRTDDPAADLLALGVAYRANARENPHFYRVMFAGRPEGVPPDRAEPTFDVLVAGVARATGSTPEEATVRAGRLWGYVHGLVMLELGGFLPHDGDEAYAAALWAGRSIIRD
ncbi:TetR/AcrR family transcriptional regulator [Isoptericola halotolerans]|uniref:TetR/AcrR family transcriptional regulator n=1 Tax=Isoptericola halotolerans TaxID=300560 RepID=UPI00388EEAB5